MNLSLIVYSTLNKDFIFNFYTIKITMYAVFYHETENHHPSEGVFLYQYINNSLQHKKISCYTNFSHA